MPCNNFRIQKKKGRVYWNGVSNVQMQKLMKPSINTIYVPAMCRSIYVSMKLKWLKKYIDLWSLPSHRVQSNDRFFPVNLIIKPSDQNYMALILYYGLASHEVLCVREDFGSRKTKPSLELVLRRPTTYLLVLLINII